MFIRCPTCKKEKLICKYYPTTGWYLWQEEKNINNWFERHVGCTDHDGMWGPTHFTLTYEQDDPNGEQELA